MKKFFLWCVMIALTVTTNLQMEFADLQERIRIYKKTLTTRKLTAQEQSYLHELMIKLNNLRSEIVLIDRTK